MWESKNFYAYYLTKFSIRLNGIWYAVETCVGRVNSSAHFILSDQCQGRELN